VQNGPSSPAPGSYPSGVPSVGPEAALQSKQTWLPGETDSRPLLSATKFGLMPWRVTVLGQNVSVDISYGTSSNLRLVDLRPPIRVTLPGSCDVYARALPNDVPTAANCEVTCIPVTSGCCESECRKLIFGAQALDPLACRFVALDAASVRVGPVGASVTVALVALQAVSLIAGSALVSGDGFLEYEP